MRTLSPEENSRIFSIMKGLGIIFVVAGHTSFFPVSGFVYLFHLAVFYFVAGYFFKDKYIDSKLLFIWKKVKGLWFPLIGYGTVFMLLHNFFFRIHIYADHLYTLQDYIASLKSLCLFATPEQLLGALWFLKSLFIASVLFMIGVWLSKRLSVRYSEVILGGGILLIIITCSVFKPLILGIGSTTLRSVLSNECFLVAILYMGRIFRNYQQHIPVNPFLTIGLFALLLYFQYNGTTVEIVSATLPPLPLFYLVSAAGCLFTYQLAVYIHKLPRLSQIMGYIGDVSLTIMALHFLAFKAINLLQIGIYGYGIDRLSDFPVIAERVAFWWAPYLVCGVVLPLLYICCKQLFIRQSGRFYNRLILTFKL